jgi:hypothetical protein
MAKRILFIICLLNPVATVLADEATNTPASLLSNGDFQTDDGNGWATGWPHPDGVTWEKEDNVRFLRFTAAEPGKMLMVYRQLVIPQPLPPALALHLRVRCEDVKPGEKPWFDARVLLQWKDANGKTLKLQPSAPNFHGSTKGWVDKTIYFSVPPHAHLLAIMPCLFRVERGTMDLSLLEVLPATADKLPPPPPMVPSETMPTTQPASSLPPGLHVVGNQLQTTEGRPVWLQGLCVDSLEWSAGGEKILQSIPVAIDQWHANVIRLPVTESYWFGWGKWQKKGDFGMTYRKLVDAAINECSARGAYLVLDLHRFGFPTQIHAAFWKDAAIRYRNHPGVIFEIFNEPHDISWKTWRDGGNIHEGTDEDVNVKENNDSDDEDVSIGMQALVDAVRSTGANNLVVAGGTDWSYNLSGILQGYALADHPGGDGVIYSNHNYPWKKDWQKSFLDVAAKYPLFLGEVGCPRKWEDFSFIPPSQQFETLGPNCTWPNDMIGLIQKYKLNWTAFSFNVKCGPPIISDWNYTPTDFWGVYVKRALAGEQFVMQRMR